MSFSRILTRPEIRIAGLSLFFLLVALQIFFLFSSPENQPHFDDFKIYYDAGHQALQHQTVYAEYADWPGKIKFKYSPLVALLFGGTVSQLPLGASQWIFYGLSLLAWLGLMGWVCKDSLLQLMPSTKTNSGVFQMRFFILAALFLAFFGNALRNEINLGQANWIPLILLFLFFQLYPRFSGKFWVAGAGLLSLAIQFKLYCVVGLYYLLIRKEFRMLAAFLGVTALCQLALPALIHGWDFAFSENLRWLVSLSASSQDLLVAYDNVSVLGVLSKKLGVGLLSRGIWVLLSALGFGYLLFKPLQPKLALYYLLMMIVLFNPLAWPYWILFAAPAFLWVGGSLLQPSASGRIGVHEFKWVLGGLVLLLLTNTIDRAATREGGVAFATLLLSYAFHLKTRSLKS